MHNNTYDNRGGYLGAAGAEGRNRAGANSPGSHPGRPVRNRTKIDMPVKGRLLLLLILFIGAFVAIGARVAYIQLAEGDVLSAQASYNQSRSVDISPRRGAILDRNGEELAVNTVVETVSINPATLRSSIAGNKNLDNLAVAEDLAYLLSIDSEAVLEKIEKDSKYEALKKKIDPEAAETVKDYLEYYKLRGIDMTEDSKRFYKYNNLAAHVIGFTTEDNRGLTGIEASMEKYIRGTPGMIKGELDARRAEVPLTVGDRVDVRDGLNAVLTIDAAIQLFATSALEKAIEDNDVERGGVIIVMDPRNSDILALVSKPDFDLNDPYAPPPGYVKETWNGRSQAGTDILNKTVWRDKAIMDTYEPGSTFKPFTVASGLEEGVISLESTFKCEPVTGYYDTPIGCWIKGSHGVEDLTHAVYNSCNPAMMRIAQRVTRPRFYSYLKDFGFYERTGVPLPGESEGIFQQDPRNVDMLVASFGQRFTVTPLELLTAYSAIANGGSLYKPRLVKELRDGNGNVITSFEPEMIRKVISKETSDILCTILEGVVSEGTGKNAYVSGYRVAGKTGTSQTTEAERYIASFCAFAPADNPVVSVLVILDDPRGDSHMGGAIAAPVVQKLLEEVLTYLEVERVYNERDRKAQMQQTVIPDLIGKSIADSVKVLQDLGLDYRLQPGITDTGVPVAAQMPPPYTRVSVKSTVVLYADAGAERIMTTAPDFKNKTTYEASGLAKHASLNIRASGAGVAKGQSVPAGSEVEAGTVVDLSFRVMDNIE